jgi:polysaccharide export outer membrane protein
MRLLATLATLCGAAGLCVGAVPASSQAAEATKAALAAAAAPQTTRAYRINSGDDLEINVWGEDRLQREVRVLPDGTFTFPLVGQIVAVNRLPSEVAADITNGLKSQYRDNVPTVTVSVKGASGFQFAVTGKVKAPGIFTPTHYVNVLDALIMAGGPAEFANMDNVLVLRKAENGHVTAIKVRLSRIFKGDASARDIADLPELESGDTVIVP